MAGQDLVGIDAGARGFDMALVVHPRRLQNVFIIGKDDKPLISLPKGKGVRLDILQEQAKKDAAKA